MIQTLRLSDFTNAFRNSDRAEQFSYEAQVLLFDYFEALEDDLGTPIEFDMIGICCEWAEEDAATLAQYYNFDSAEPDAVLEAMQDATQVAGVTSKGKIVYVQF
jgi:hypothetical protein